MAAVAEGKPIGKKGLADVSLMDEWRKAGWRIENLASGWSAYEINGDRKIGPAKTLAALETQIKITTGQTLEGKSNGNGKTVKVGTPTKLEGGEYKEKKQTESVRLPTMEEPELDDLNRQADECIDAKAERDKAKAAFDDECDVMRQKMREHGRKRYSRRGFSLVIEDSEKLVIKKAEQAPPKNPSTKKKQL